MKEVQMKTAITKALEKEIKKIENKAQKDYVLSIFRLEKEKNIDLESDMMGCAIIPLQIGANMGVDPKDSQVWYQQYRTMKALIIKRDLTKNNNQSVIDSAVDFLAQRTGKTKSNIKKAIKKLDVENLMSEMGIDLTKDPAEQTEQLDKVFDKILMEEK